MTRWIFFIHVIYFEKDIIRLSLKLLNTILEIAHFDYFCYLFYIYYFLGQCCVAYFFIQLQYFWKGYH